MTGLGARRAPAVQVLVVCTGNICRSPVAAAYLARRLDARGVEADVTSAGLIADGIPVDERTRVAAGAVLDLDIATHRSRRLSAGDVEGADLVVGMAREHVREAVLLSPEAWARTFTLKELVRHAGVIGPRAAGVALAPWLAGLVAGRSRASLSGSAVADDVADPIGASLETCSAIVAEIAALVDALVELAWPAGTVPVSV